MIAILTIILAIPSPIKINPKYLEYFYYDSADKKSENKNKV